MFAGCMCMIGGTGRSGTTILKRVFSKHPDVAAVPEWYFTIQPDGLVDFYETLSTRWSPYLADSKVRRLENLLRTVSRASLPAKLYTVAMARTGIGQIFPFKLQPRYGGVDASKYCPAFKSLVDELIDNLVDFRYSGHWTGSDSMQRREMLYVAPRSPAELARVLGDFYRKVVSGVVDHARARFWVEDNTWNFIWFRSLLALLPEARLVHVYRDPRDVVASYTKQTWMPTDPARSATVYTDIMSRWFQVREELPPETFIEISLEDLVQCTESTLRRVCEFWEIPWHGALLDTDLSRSNSGRWKHDLSSSEADQVQRITEVPLRKLGYS